MRFATLASLILSAVVSVSLGFVNADEADELTSRAQAVKSEAAQLLENGQGIFVKLGKKLGPTRLRSRRSMNWMHRSLPQKANFSS